MSIFKVTPSDLFDAEMAYVVIPCETIALYKSVWACSLHVYLLDKPEDWIIRDKDLIGCMVGMSEKMMKRAVRELKSVGLLKTIQLFNEENRFAGKQRDLFAHPSLNPDFGGELDTNESNQIPESADSTPTGESTGLRDDLEAGNGACSTMEVPESANSPPTAIAHGGELDPYTHNEFNTHKESITHVTADADDALDNFDFDDVEDSNPPSEEKTEPPDEWEDLSPMRDLLRSLGKDPSLANRKAMLAINQIGVSQVSDADKIEIIQTLKGR